MAFRELIKNYEYVRRYIHHFYVYGFKTRNDYDHKSARTYDDIRRRVEGWLGDFVRFSRSSKGKALCLSVDCRSIPENPLYRSFQTKSFTDNDIVLHFLIMDCFHENAELSFHDFLSKACEIIPQLASIDESTVRKKLNEYVQLGLLLTHRKGRTDLYSLTATAKPEYYGQAAIDFFSETSPVGVIGYFIKSRLPAHSSAFRFKHHFIWNASDSEILLTLFESISCKQIVELKISSTNEGVIERSALPICIHASTQNGRRHLIAYSYYYHKFIAVRVDRILKVKPLSPEPNFEQYRQQYKDCRKHLWGVSFGNYQLEHLSFDITYDQSELFIPARMMREKRIGTVKEIAPGKMRFSADVFDSREVLPWIRTFIGRISEFHCSNKEVEQQFKEDIRYIVGLYGETE